MDKPNSEWKKFFEEYRWRVLMPILFLVLAILFITIGFWKTILIMLFLLLGFSIGYMRDNNIDFETFIDGIRSMIGI